MVQESLKFFLFVNFAGNMSLFLVWGLLTSSFGQSFRDLSLVKIDLPRARIF